MHSVSSCNFYHPSSTHQSKLGSINKSSGLSLPEVDGHTLLLLQHWWWWWSCSQVVLLRVFLPPTCGTKDALVEGYAQGCKVKLLRSLPTLCTLVHILQMEQLLRERHPSISAQQMKENTEAGNFCKGEWSLNFILLLCFFYLLASCSLKGFCFVLFCFVLIGGWFLFLHGWWVVPDCCSAGYTLCKASSRVACTWCMIHMTTTKVVAKGVCYISAFLSSATAAAT